MAVTGYAMPRDCFARWRGDDGIVHAACKMTYEHCYAGWWMAICGAMFTKVAEIPLYADSGRGVGSREEPTCIRCLANEHRGTVWAP